MAVDYLKIAIYLPVRSYGTNSTLVQDLDRFAWSEGINTHLV